MTARPLVLCVGHAPAMLEARRDERLDLRRCEDALDALALASTLDTPPVAILLDQQAAALEDLPSLVDAAAQAGLPVPRLFPDQDEAVSVWDLLQEPEQPRQQHADTHDASDSEAGAAVDAIADALGAVLEGGPALATMLERCSSFGVRLVAEPEPGLPDAVILDGEGDPIAHLVAPPALAPLLPALARVCSGLAGIEDAIEDLIDDASTDAHTGLPDRYALLEELERRIDDARPARHAFTLTLLRLAPKHWDDPDAPHAHAERADFAAVVSWGVLALLGDEMQAVTEAPEGAHVEASIRVVYPWDGADPVALLEEGEALLRATVRTDTV